MAAVLHKALGAYAAVFLDDIVAFSPDFESHLQHVDNILGMLQQAGL